MHHELDDQKICSAGAVVFAIVLLVPDVYGDDNLQLRTMFSSQDYCCVKVVLTAHPSLGAIVCEAVSRWPRWSATRSNFGAPILLWIRSLSGPTSGFSARMSPGRLGVKVFPRQKKPRVSQPLPARSSYRGR